MAGLQFFDGFDKLNATTDLALLSGFWTGTPSAISGTSSRFGTGRYFRNPTVGAVTFLMPATSDAITFGAAHKETTGAAAGGTVWWRLSTAAGTQIIQIGANAAGAILVGRGDFTTNLISQSANGVVTAGNWHYIEVEMTRNGTTGVVRVWVDGVQVINDTGKNTGATTWGQINFRDNDGTGGQYDDFYYADDATSHLGDCRVETLSPDADTAQKDFSRSTGSDNFALVNETPSDGDTSYVTDSVVGHKDLYDLGALSSTPATIHGVNVQMVARKDDATARTARCNLKSGATTTNGTTRTMGTSYAWFKQLFKTDPNTSAAWTASAVNAAQTGPEIVS